MKKIIYEDYIFNSNVLNVLARLHNFNPNQVNVKRHVRVHNIECDVVIEYRDPSNRKHTIGIELKRFQGYNCGVEVEKLIEQCVVRRKYFTYMYGIFKPVYPEVEPFSYMIICLLLHREIYELLKLAHAIGIGLIMVDKDNNVHVVLKSTYRRRDKMYELLHDINKELIKKYGITDTLHNFTRFMKI